MDERAPERPPDDAPLARPLSHTERRLIEYELGQVELLPLDCVHTVALIREHRTDAVPSIGPIPRGIALDLIDSLEHLPARLVYRMRLAYGAP